MGKAFIFGAGIITGIISVPVVLVYVTPVQKAATRLGVSIYTFGLRRDGDFREKATYIRDSLTDMLDTNPLGGK